MSPSAARRGFDPDDHKWFSPQAVAQLTIAHEEVQWLLDRGYKTGSIIDLVGDHYQLSIRQRAALQRSTASQRQYQKRISTLLPLTMMRDGIIYIDGFNLIITLEVALSGSLLILGNDGVLRDLASLRGTYHMIAQTDIALELIGKSLAELAVPGATLFLDAPVSNSGKLRQRILSHAAAWGMPVSVELVPNADPVLAKKERIITGDSILLDQCASWFNLSRKIVADDIPNAWIVSFKHAD